MPPANTTAHFDAGTIAARGLARNGGFIPRWPGDAGGQCRDRLVSRGGNSFRTNTLGSGPSVNIASQTGQLETANCRFWRAGAADVFLVAAAMDGSEPILASETAGYDTPGGYIIEVIEGRLCVSQRGGQPFLCSATRFTAAPGVRYPPPRLVHVEAGAGGRWRLLIDGAVEDAAHGSPLTPEEGANFRAGRLPGRPSTSLFQLGLMLSAAGGLAAEERRAVEDHTAARWGVELRRPGQLPADVRETLAPCIDVEGVLDVRCAVEAVQQMREQEPPGEEGGDWPPPPTWPSDWPGRRWSGRAGGRASYWPLIGVAVLAFLLAR